MQNFDYHEGGKARAKHFYDDIKQELQKISWDWYNALPDEQKQERRIQKGDLKVFVKAKKMNNRNNRKEMNNI